jgi:ribonuclease BN (tRNA processing enzyme)
MGLVHFPCLNHSSFTVRIAGAGESEKKFKDNVRELFYASPYWPSQTPKAKLLMYEIMEDTYDLSPDIQLTAVYTNHPTTTLGYRLNVHGKIIVYIPDSEISGQPTAMEMYDEKLTGFCANADLLIHDTCYSDSDYKAHAQQGHSGAGSVVKFAGAKVKAKQLVMFNFHSTYHDEDIELIENAAQKDAKRYNLACSAARDGMEIII